MTLRNNLLIAGLFLAFVAASGQACAQATAHRHHHNGTAAPAQTAAQTREAAAGDVLTPLTAEEARREAQPSLADDVRAAFAKIAVRRPAPGLSHIPDLQPASPGLAHAGAEASIRPAAALPFDKSSTTATDGGDHKLADLMHEAQTQSAAAGPMAYAPLTLAVMLAGFLALRLVVSPPKVERVRAWASARPGPREPLAVRAAAAREARRRGFVRGAVDGGFGGRF